MAHYQTPADSAKRECPDTGACHHRCGDGACFRVMNCGPLSCAEYPNDRWPAEIVAEQRRRGGLPIVSAGDVLALGKRARELADDLDFMHALIVAANDLDREAMCSHGTEGAAADPSVCSACVAIMLRGWCRASGNFLGSDDQCGSCAPGACDIVRGPR